MLAVEALQVARSLPSSDCRPQKREADVCDKSSVRMGLVVRPTTELTRIIAS
jgi:hypothetical protein